MMFFVFISNIKHLTFRTNCFCVCIYTPQKPHPLFSLPSEHAAVYEEGYCHLQYRWKQVDFNGA